MKRYLQAIFVFAVCFSAVRTVAAPVAVTGFKKDSDGVTLQMRTGVLRLEVQTNSLAAGLGTNWVTVDGSTGTNQMIIPLNTTNGSVFYRLVYP